MKSKKSLLYKTTIAKFENLNSENNKMGIFVRDNKVFLIEPHAIFILPQIMLRNGDEIAAKEYKAPPSWTINHGLSQLSSETADFFKEHLYRHLTTEKVNDLDKLLVEERIRFLSNTKKIKLSQNECESRGIKYISKNYAPEKTFTKINVQKKYSLKEVEDSHWKTENEFLRRSFFGNPQTLNLVKRLFNDVEIHLLNGEDSNIELGTTNHTLQQSLEKAYSQTTQLNWIKLVSYFNKEENIKAEVISSVLPEVWQLPSFIKQKNINK